MLYEKNIVEVLYTTINDCLRVCNDNSGNNEREKIAILIYIFNNYNTEYKQFLNTLKNLQFTFSNYYHSDIDVNNNLFLNIREMRSVYQYRYDILSNIDSTINNINADINNVDNDKLPTIRQIIDILTTNFKENTTFSSYELYVKDVDTSYFKQIPLCVDYLEKWKLIQTKQKGSLNVIVSWLKRYTSLIKNKLEDSNVRKILQELNKNNYVIRETDIDIAKVVSYWEKVKSIE